MPENIQVRHIDTQIMDSIALLLSVQSQLENDSTTEVKKITIEVIVPAGHEKVWSDLQDIITMNADENFNSWEWKTAIYTGYLLQGEESMARSVGTRCLIDLGAINKDQLKESKVVLDAQDLRKKLFNRIQKLFKDRKKLNQAEQLGGSGTA